MRFSPVLLASITISAGLSVASSAQASSSADFNRPGAVEHSIDSSDLGKSDKPSARTMPTAITPEFSEANVIFSSGQTVVQSDVVSLVKPDKEKLIEKTEGYHTTEKIPVVNVLPTEIDTTTTATAGEEVEIVVEMPLAKPSVESTVDITINSELSIAQQPAVVESDDSMLASADLWAQVSAPPSEEDGTSSDTVEAEEGEPGEIELEREIEVEPRVLISEVLVLGVESQPDLRNRVYQVIQTRPGRTTTRSQLQDDINAVFATGFFANVQAEPEDTPLGVRVTFTVQPNPVLQRVEVSNSNLSNTGTTLTFGEQELTVNEITNAIFSPQYNRTLNLRDFQAGIDELNTVYQENGYVLAQVVDAPNVSQDGVVTLSVAEGVIENIEVQFLDEDGFAEDEEGNPIDGRTRDFIITREFEAQPGDVFNQRNIQRDLQRVFGLGIFDDVRVALNPGDDPRKVDVIVNVIEGSTGSIAAGAGFSSASGLFGSASYQQQNLGGNNQRLGTEIQFGQRELLFDVSFSDPWIATDPYRTSYSVNSFLRRSISLIFDGGDREVDLCEDRNDRNCNQDDLEDGDRPRVQRLGGGISFSRPLDEWLGWENWRASTGLQYQRVSIRDGDGDLSFIDAEGNQLSFSDDGRDDLFTLQLAAVRDLRNNPQQPTSGSLLRVGTEQSIPFGSGSILMNRLRGSYSHYVPVDLTSFKDGPEALAFNIQAGTVLGDLPPYEAFSLGGTDSVRGYDAGEVGSGRSFVQASAEYRFPIFSIVGGALFMDFGSDLGTGDNVPGEPANVRDKPGTGFGYGLGVRVQSPLGQIRVDYGINDDGDGRIHFGIGERF
ncbi:MAG: BamA/TamA family outer membrane protein [Cyanobacteria bacterium P01_F01_bin.150]